MALEVKNNNQNFKLILATRKRLILAIVLAWAAVGVAFFGIKSQVIALLDQRQELEKTRQELSQLKIKSSDLKQIEVSKQFQKKEKVDEVLPSHKPLLELLTNLQQAAMTTKVTLEEFSVSPGKVASVSAQPLNVTDPKQKTKRSSSGRSYDTLDLKLIAKGESASVDEFTSLVERIVPFTTITDLKIKRQTVQASNLPEATASASSSEVVTAEADISLSTYYFTQSISTTLAQQLPSIGDEEIEAFEKIQQFRPSDFQPVTQLKEGTVEDLFEVEGIEAFR